MYWELLSILQIYFEWNPMKKALMMGGIAPFCDLVKVAEEKNIECIVCDYNKDAPAKKMVNIAYDISTVKTPEVLRIAKDNKVEGVITAFSDRNLLPALRVAEALGLPNIYTEEIIALLTDKIKMKERMVQNKIPVIPYKVLHIDFKDNELSGLTFPVVIKPIDAYGSKGIYICESIEEVREKFSRATKEALLYKEDIIVEEFYPVDEISISGWVDQGKVYSTCIYDVVKNYKSGICLAAVDFPSKYTKNYFNKLQQLFQKVVGIFGISEGPVTLQCFIGDRGLKVSELLFRLAGGSPYLYACYLGGPNVAKMWIEKCMGDSVELQNLKSFIPIAKERFFDIQLFVKEAGRIRFGFKNSEIYEKIPECIDVRDYFSDGDEVLNVPDTGKMVMRLICKIKDCTDQKYGALLERILENLPIYNEDMRNIASLRFPENLGCNTLYQFE